MKNFVFFLFTVALLSSCNQSAPSQADNDAANTETSTPVSDKGVGEIKNVSINDPLNEQMIEKGKAIYEMKCSACHKLTDQRVVGPGFTGVTDRRKPEWIMNMITNTDAMLDEDPQARALLEECLTRMPNQNVSVGDARDILEFLLHNDAQ